MREDAVELSGRIFVRKAWSKCAVMAAAGIGGCAIAPSSHRAWAAGGVAGSVAAVVPVAADALAGAGGFRALLKHAAIAVRIPAAASAAAVVRALFMVTP